MRVLSAVVIQMAVFVVCMVYIKLYGYKLATRLFLASNYLIGSNVMGLRLEAERIRIPDRLLVVSNHPTFIDFMYIIHWARLQGRLDDLVFIAKESIGRIPIIGPIFGIHSV